MHHVLQSLLSINRLTRLCVCADTFLLDQTVRNIAVERLNVAIENWNKTKQPFFVGMGTHRPHLGWEFPIEYEIPTPEEEGEPRVCHRLCPEPCVLTDRAFVFDNGSSPGGDT
jgi:hypothetical protein